MGNGGRESAWLGIFIFVLVYLCDLNELLRVLGYANVRVRNWSTVKMFNKNRKWC